MKIAQIFYADNPELGAIPSTIISYTNSLIQIPALSEVETYQVNLTLSEEELFRNLKKSNRNQIKQATSKSFTHIIETQPSNTDLLQFQQYYNEFAKKKHTNKCKAYHLKTMKLLRDQHALVLTKLLSDQGELYAYRIYLTDHIRAYTLYSASHFRNNILPETKRLSSIASRYLMWKNILWFKQTGHEIYDLGSLTEDENIRQYKMGFGGEIVKAYSGYISTNRTGKFILWLRKVKMNSRRKTR